MRKRPSELLRKFGAILLRVRSEPLTYQHSRTWTRGRLTSHASHYCTTAAAFGQALRHTVCPCCVVEDLAFTPGFSQRHVLPSSPPPFLQPFRQHPCELTHTRRLLRVAVPTLLPSCVRSPRRCAAPACPPPEFESVSLPPLFGPPHCFLMSSPHGINLVLSACRSVLRAITTPSPGCWRYPLDHLCSLQSPAMSLPPSALRQTLPVRLVSGSLSQRAKLRRSQSCCNRAARRQRYTTS